MFDNETYETKVIETPLLIEDTPVKQEKVEKQKKYIPAVGDVVEIIHGEDAPNDGWKSPHSTINNDRGYTITRITADGKSAFLAKPFNAFVPLHRLLKKP